jgi:hypothetical protein
MSNGFEIDFLEDYSKPSLITELQRIQQIVGNRPITKADIDKYGKAGWTTYFRKFGSFRNALLEAGLQPSRYANVSNDELIQEIITIWTKTLEKEGRRPYTSDIKKYHSPYQQDTYRRRFGSWKKALILAYNSINAKDDVESETEEFSKNDTDRKTTKISRIEPSIRTRFLVFKRDQFTCVFCSCSGVGVKLEVDHIIPLSKGGSNRLDNLQTLCFECNRGKRNDFEKLSSTK